MSAQVNYIIRGADGLEYGPVTAEQVREWVAQNRANQASWIRVEGEEPGGRLADRAEFADLFGGGQVPPLMLGGVSSEGAAGGGAAGATQGAGERLAAEVLARDYDLRIGECFGRGWELVRERFVLTAGASALVVLVYVGLNSIPVIGGLAALALTAVLFGGLDLVFLRLLRKQPVDLGVAFSGFGPAFLGLLLLGVVSQILTGIGLLLCVIPGIYLMVAWSMFTPLLVLDRGLDFWQAMECSRRVVTRHWWVCFGLLLVALLLLAGGALLLLVGLVVALPWATGAIVVAYEQIFGNERNETP